MNSLYNLARVTTVTTGTGTITLGSALSGFLTFAQAGVPDGAVVTYAISDGANSEVGQGTYTLSGLTLTRTTVYRSTGAANTGKINLSGSAQVVITPAAEDFALASPTLSGTVTFPGVGATTWDSAGLNAHRFVWNAITDGASGQPLFDIFDTSMDPAEGSTGVAMRFFGRQQNLASVEGAVINCGLKVTTTDATKGDIDFVAYNWNGTTLSIGAHVALDGQTGAFEPTLNNTYDLGTTDQGWRDFYVARAIFLNASAGTAGQVPISAGAGAAAVWGLPSKVLGTTTNDNGAAGHVGEYISASAGSTGITAFAQTNITSISLTAGDWDVEGLIYYSPAASTVVGQLVASISSVSATLSTAGLVGRTDLNPSSNTGKWNAIATGRKRISISSTTTIYLVGYADFVTSTLNTLGEICARRVR